MVYHFKVFISADEYSGLLRNASQFKWKDNETF